MAVRTRGIQLVAHHAFSVDPPITATIEAGSPQPGGLLMISLRNQDTVSFGKIALVGAISSLGFGNADADGVSSSGDASRASFLAFVDPLAPPGLTRIEAVNVSTTLSGATVFSDTFATGPDAVRINPRRSIESVPANAMGVDGQVLAPYSARLYRTPTRSSGLVTVSVAATGARLVPRLNVYPSSGRSDDFVGWTAAETMMSATSLTYPTAGAADTYSIVSDVALGGGGLSYEYLIAATLTPVPILPETGDFHYATSLAQELCDGSAQNCLLDGRIGAPGEQDVYVFPTVPSPSHWVVYARVPVRRPMGPPRLQGHGTREARQDDRREGCLVPRTASIDFSPRRTAPPGAPASA